MINQLSFNNEGGKGIFIVIEGTDGSGKSTQLELLKQRLQQTKHKVTHIHFPRYENESSFFVRQYLKGQYGSANDVGPYTGSVFYAMDRFQAAHEIKQALDEGQIVICDRYVASNMAHQGNKFSNSEERRGYYIWLDNFEFEVLKIPRPDINFVLSNSIEIIKDRLNAKESSSAHIKKDIHEKDLSHIEKSLEVYNELSDLFPKDFYKIDCTRDGQTLKPDEIHNLLWNRIEPLLPDITDAENNTNDEEVYALKDGSNWTITEKGHNFLKESVTNAEDDVYVFTEKLSPVTIAAAMARLSRRGDDMRITLLDEFANNLGKDEALLKRVISAYGDDSVQQLAGLHIVVENGSNLLSKKLEWGRLASYLEQSTRYIYFDQKDKNGKYRYHTPEHFDNEIQIKYNSVMNEIFDIYSDVVHSLTDHITITSSVPKKERDIAWKSAVRAQACDAARGLLPVATQSTVGIYASGQALESLIMHLLSDDLPEAQITGQKILTEARKIIPSFLERADKPDRGGATIAYRSTTNATMKKTADEILKNSHADSSIKSVDLIEYWPKNELDLVSDMLYEHSDLSLKDIEIELSNTSYDAKAKIFKQYIGERLNRRHRPGRALEKAHYSWDITCDYGIFRDLQRHRMVDDLNWQQLTPRFGFEIPELIEQSNLVDKYERAFELSLELYSYLQSNGHQLEAQYATLLGHKMRWKVTYNARQAFHLHELRTTPHGHPGYRKLVNELHDKLTEVHPLIGEAMIFVNKDEDPELSRLAAEKYTQFKLQQIKNDDDK